MILLEKVIAYNFKVDAISALKIEAVGSSEPIVILYGLHDVITQKTTVINFSSPV
jgi:hypothetical protein